jgi:hypothetical protein
MRTIIIILINICLTLFIVFGSTAENPIDNSLWDELLREYVSADGRVNYNGIKSDEAKLDKYLKILDDHVPEKTWEENEKLAFWINAYNAFTIALIIDHYPIKSIMAIDKAWDQKFIQLGGKVYSLNEIEHEIIRKQFDEPRIHFALVCAAISCPVLRNESYEPEKLDEQLEQQGLKFINDPDKNIISSKKATVSQLFNWFKEDFTKKGTLVDYLNQFSEKKLSQGAKINFMEYDWGLNE